MGDIVIIMEDFKLYETRYSGIPMVHEGNSDSWVSVDKFIELYEEDYDAKKETISVLKT